MHSHSLLPSSYEITPGLLHTTTNTQTIGVGMGIGMGIGEEEEEDNIMITGSTTSRHNSRVREEKIMKETVSNSNKITSLSGELNDLLYNHLSSDDDESEFTESENEEEVEKTAAASTSVTSKNKIMTSPANEIQIQIDQQHEQKQQQQQISCLRKKRRPSNEEEQSHYMEIERVGAMSRAKAALLDVPNNQIEMTNNGRMSGNRNRNSIKKRSTKNRYGNYDSSYHNSNSNNSIVSEIMNQNKNLLALGTKKRDRRSIEEIQRDIRKRRADSHEGQGQQHEISTSSPHIHSSSTGNNDTIASTTTAIPSNNLNANINTTTSPPPSSAATRFPVKSSTNLHSIANNKSVHGRLAKKILGRSSQTGQAKSATKAAKVASNKSTEKQSQSQVRKISFSEESFIKGIRWLERFGNLSMTELLDSKYTILHLPRLLDGLSKEIQATNMSEVLELIDYIDKQCNQALAKKQESITICDVSISPLDFYIRLQENSMLSILMKRGVVRYGFHTVEDLLYYRHKFHCSMFEISQNIPEWKRGKLEYNWSRKNDLELLCLTYELGYGAWKEIGERLEIKNLKATVPLKKLAKRTRFLLQFMLLLPENHFLHIPMLENNLNVSKDEDQNAKCSPVNGDSKKCKSSSSSTTHNYEYAIQTIEPVLKKLKSYSSNAENSDIIVKNIATDLLQIGKLINMSSTSDEIKKLWQYSSQYTKLNGNDMEKLYRRLSQEVEKITQ